MRGKLLAFTCDFRRFGNIPAYAGKTHRIAASGKAEPEHPRVCGENCWPLPVTFGVLGTSPRMRGKPWRLWRQKKPWRNIPAYAGKTVSDSPKKAQAAEHPRVCGENWGQGRQHCGGIGTSPRMRGKPVIPVDSLVGYGNIPAYAGKTRPQSHAKLPEPEHPRVCGENLMQARLMLLG